ncbi:MAG: hypothetical protein ACYC61_32405 [Isosphaeraceae bacterium]
MRRHASSFRPKPRLVVPAPARLALGAAALLALAGGCEEERHVGSGAGAPARSKKAADSGPIIGRRTSDIKDAQAELKTGQARVVSNKAISTDPFRVPSSAYTSAISQLSEGQIKHAIDLYHATNDRYPKDYDEFVNEILKPNNIALPVLPPYQEYGYDANEHKLIILEYPARKNPPPQ